jgi:hypothetical protein
MGSTRVRRYNGRMVLFLMNLYEGYTAYKCQNCLLLVDRFMLAK